MIQLLHTLYITEPDTELRLKGEALRVIHGDGREDHVPLHLLSGIVTFSYGTVTQPVMAACAKRQIQICFLSQRGGSAFGSGAGPTGMSCCAGGSICSRRQNGSP